MRRQTFVSIFLSFSLFTGYVLYTLPMNFNGYVPFLINTPTASLQKDKIPTNECPVYDAKQSDGEAPVMLEH